MPQRRSRREASGGVLLPNSLRGWPSARARHASLWRRAREVAGRRGGCCGAGRRNARWATQGRRARARAGVEADGVGRGLAGRRTEEQRLPDRGRRCEQKLRGPWVRQRLVPFTAPPQARKGNSVATRSPERLHPRRASGPPVAGLDKPTAPPARLFTSPETAVKEPVVDVFVNRSTRLRLHPRYRQAKASKALLQSPRLIGRHPNRSRYAAWTVANRPRVAHCCASLCKVHVDYTPRNMPSPIRARLAWPAKPLRGSEGQDMQSMAAAKLMLPTTWPAWRLGCTAIDPPAVSLLS